MMLINIMAAELIAWHPEQVVASVLTRFLGTPPTPGFLKRHRAQIEADDLGFLHRYLKQWPDALRSNIGTYEPGHLAMKRLENTVSVGFLKAVPAEGFLACAYRDFFGREVDDGGHAAYGDLDFSLQENRDLVIGALATSEEFLSNPRVIAGSAKDPSSLRDDEAASLSWDPRPAVSTRWYGDGPTTARIAGRFVPILLWMPERRSMYSAPGMELVGSLDGNVLNAAPEWAVWGPKSACQAGNYRLRVDVEGERTDLFIMDVASNGGTKCHVRLEFFGSLNVEIPLEFECETPEVEFRIFNFTGRHVPIVVNEISISAQ